MNIFSSSILLLSFSSIFYLYYKERKRTNELLKIIKSLPNSKIVAKQATITADKYNELNTYQKSVFESGFIAGSIFIYSELNKNITNQK